jgi:hypothetical protein
MTAAADLGTVEGFFGPVWTWAEREAVMRRLAGEGYGFYLYAPKADVFLRRRWHQLHPAAEMTALAAFAGQCREAGVRFGVGLSPYEVHFGFSGDARAVMAEKLAGLDAAGLDILAILFDDMKGDLESLARRQAEIVDFAAARTKAKQIIVCPSYYSDDPVLDRVFGPRPDDYLRDLGRALDPAIAVMWTGEEVCSREYSLAHLDRVAEEIGRKPFLWDNYPVNDGPRMGKHLHLRAFTGRPAAMAGHIAGHAVNPASQPTLSMIPMLTLSWSYARGAAYAYGAAFREAADAIVGEELGALLERHLLLLDDAGLGGLSDEQHTNLRARYAAIDHPAAAEVVRWLDGGYAMTGEELQTQ